MTKALLEKNRKPDISMLDTLKKTKTNDLFVDLVFNHPLQQTFTYKIPEELMDVVTFGKRVSAPFGRKRTLTGYVLRVHQNRPDFELKDIIEVVDKEVIFNDRVVNLAKWVAEYYLCSLGEALGVCIPKESKEKPYSLKKIAAKSLLNLNKEQAEVVKLIINSMNKKEFSPFLLYGVTGSGKTEVYKYLAHEAVKNGFQALVLVPEIALTPQTIGRFQHFFGERIAVLHSKLGQKERFYNWKLIQKGEVDIILGARSAIFSSIDRLGIIIIDEEHEGSYKSGDTPRYHARQLAFKIAQTRKIPVVMGSATPAIESYYYGQMQKITTLSLKERHSAYQNQKMTLVDMRKEKSNSFISQTLFEKISQCLLQKEQVMIFLNKRGYSPLLICQDCGHSLKCPNCDISLTYHQDKKNTLCHYCHYSHTISTTCNSCGGKDIILIGYGTERIEEQLKELFVQAKIGRMDFDSTRKKGAHEQILTQFKKGEIDILIGTQMIAKGLHFPNVTLVGVVLADLTLNLPDFRASEKTFSLLTQISGRAGRGEIQGEVVIQTYLPDNYVIQSALQQDYEAFYQQEIKERKEFAYPPFTRFIKLLVRGKKEENVIRSINDLYHQLRTTLTGGIDILGPAPAPLSKLNNNFRWQMILKGKRMTDLQNLARIAQEKFKNKNSLYLEIDVDPLSMM